MVFKVDAGVSAPFQPPANDAQGDAARKSLNDLASHITVQSGGSKYPGRLVVKNLGAAQRGEPGKQVEIRRAGLFRQIFTTTSRVERGNAYLRGLMVSAYKDKISPEHYERTLAKVDKYLKDTRGMQGLGGRRLVEFVREFEAAPILSQASTYLDSDTNRLITSRRGLVGVATWEAAAENIRTGVTGLPGVDAHVNADGWTEQVPQLAQGQEGIAYAVRMNAQDKVVKIATNLPPLDPALRKGEVAAVGVPNAIGNVVRPTDFLVRVRRGEQAEPQVYKVPAQPGALRDFLVQQNRAAVASGIAPEISLHGAIMPRANGQPVDALQRTGPVSDQDFDNLATGLYVGLEEMRTNRLVHHDIKPANVIYDPATGQTSIIDLGGMVRLGRDDADGGTTTTSTVGSPAFQAPASRLGQPHGAEVDRFSYAVTLLSALEPGLSSPELRKHLPTFFGGELSMKDDPSVQQAYSPEQYLGAYQDALRRMSPGKADALEARLQARPELGQILHNAFLGSAGGDAGEAAWSQVRTAFGACAPSRLNTRQLMNALEYDLRALSDDAALQATYDRVAQESGFPHPLSSLDGGALKTRLMKALRAAATVPGSDPVTYRPMSHAQAQTAIDDSLRQMMRRKTDQLATMNALVTDPDLRAVMAEDILYCNFSNAVYALMADYAPRLKDTAETLSAGRAVEGLHECRNTFLALDKEQVDGERIFDPELMTAIRSAGLRYAQAKGVDLAAAADTLASAAAVRVYGLFNAPAGAECPLATALPDAGARNALSQSTRSDLDIFNTFVRVVGHMTGRDLVDTVAEALPPDDADLVERESLIALFYPDLVSQLPPRQA